MEAFCEKRAQQSGVAKVKHNPQNKTWIGELAQRYRFKIVDLFSRKFTKTGVKTIPKKKKKKLLIIVNGINHLKSPGQAMKILDNVTCAIPCWAALTELP